MKEITEIIFNGDPISDVDGTLPLKKGDKFYYSVSDVYPKSREEYKKNSVLPESFCDEYLDTIEKKSKKYHIKEFVVVSVTRSLREDINKQINGMDYHIYLTSIEVRES